MRREQQFIGKNIHDIGEDRIPETIAEEMERLNADGVDFVPIGFNPMNASDFKIYESYTKQEFIACKGYPKSPYIFWKMINGRKTYLICS